jgi:hypothetical protein
MVPFDVVDSERNLGYRGMAQFHRRLSGIDRGFDKVQQLQRWTFDSLSATEICRTQDGPGAFA